ncbi:hypothetical protein [Mucilaginibacter segetis]|uniref:Uncharacterized protein n=1 Tax=Mucilaginibacter segetis TaxID=2793071 RepID=A0A934PUQ4_9SPHI|nr:hypothetical protein [Mucilaginibacter segetis]MBK0379445.1 hypothetical protein [Mucilaginibacter segetis]
MNDRQKKIFLAICITVPFLLYSVYYYGMIIKNAPYRFAEFDSMVFKYGYNDSLVNQYDSKTGDYQYVNSKDSLVKMHLKLTKDDLLYLHRKAADLGFWDFPVDETKDDTAKIRSPRYYIEFNYKRKSKKVTFDEAYNGDPKLIDANEQLIKEIKSKLSDAEGRQKQ